MEGGFATLTEAEGVLVTSADVNGFTLAELRFPPGYVQGEFEPELPYLALVLEGALEKSFRLRTMQLSRACGVTMPAGARHRARFGANGARVLIVKPRTAAYADCLGRLATVRAPALGWLAWRLAAELRAADTAAPLAAEGLALELLAGSSRETAGTRDVARGPSWLAAAEELLRARLGEYIGLGDVAMAIGVHPTHLSRVFRARYGVSVGEYVRRLRVAWAAAELARGDSPLAAIATQAGFADQSHFTRVFKQHVGMTPARYRAEMQRADARGVPQ